MIGTAVQLALREWHRQMRAPAFWITAIGISALLALMGPFGTGEVLSIPAAFFYWLCISVVSYSVGVIITVLFAERRLGSSVWWAIVLRGVVIGFFIFVFVMGLNRVTFGTLEGGPSLITWAGRIVVVAIIVTGLVQVLFGAAGQGAEPQTQGTAPPALLDRLPLDKRGPVYALSVEDHYVRVYTSKGEELLLMRLSDAIREMGEAAGAQVHRSHWVAWDAVEAVQREGARAILTLTNGTQIPVSRANVPKIKEAGLLPR